MLPLVSALALLGVATASAIDKAAALSECLSAAQVPVDAADSTDYKLDASPYNLRLVYTPISIAVPTTPKHVQDAVACAAKIGIKTNAKSGGHSYGSFGLGGEDGHLVIELDRYNQVVLDNVTGIAKVQGGARLGHVASELWDQGKRALSHGTCPGVGVGGHVVHGGYGVSSHTKGLALDWLVGATVVLANSTIVDCSETENPDLFWAIRGAGSSMGVVTEFRFDTFPAPEVLTYYVAALKWGTAERMIAGFKLVQEFAQDMPKELNMRLFMTPRFINLEGLYYGDKASFKAIFDPLVAKTGATVQLTQQGGWLDQMKHFGGGLSLDQGHPYDVHETFNSASLYTKALNETQISHFANYWFKYAKSNKRDWYVHIDVHGGKNSAVSSKAADSTAYAHRDYLFMYLFYDRVDKGVFPASGFSHIQNYVQNITDGLSASQWGRYLNYPDPSLDQVTAQEDYWGDNLAKLKGIKKAVDPQDLFYYPQGVQA